MLTLSIRDLPQPGAYVRGWKRCRAIVAAGDTVRIRRDGPDLDAEGFEREMRRALDRCINVRVPRQLGRKHDPDYQRHLWLDVYDINRLVGHRIRPGLCRWRTPELQRRFGHLLEHLREE